jgi:hypothetical protein
MPDYVVSLYFIGAICVYILYSYFLGIILDEEAYEKGNNDNSEFQFYLFIGVLGSLVYPITITILLIYGMVVYANKIGQKTRKQIKEKQ